MVTYRLPKYKRDFSAYLPSTATLLYYCIELHICDIRMKKWAGRHKLHQRDICIRFVSALNDKLLLNSGRYLHGLSNQAIWSLAKKFDCRKFLRQDLATNNLMTDQVL